MKIFLFFLTYFVLLEFACTEISIAQSPPENPQNNETVIKILRPGRVFKIDFEPSMFEWSEDKNYWQFIYRPSIKGLPDLPEWIKYFENPDRGVGFIYGVPPVMTDDELELEIVAKNLVTYETSVTQMVLKTARGAHPDDRENEVNVVKLKIDNMNLDDLFVRARLDDLKKIFIGNLWTEARDDIYVSFIATSLDVGYRKPVRPNQKDGVVVHLASKMEFSDNLKDLDRETAVLRVIPSCPRNFLL